MLNGLLLSSALSLALLAGFGARAEAQTTITISCSSLGIELQLCQTGADAWGKQTNNQVKLASTPADATERLSLYQTLLAAHSSDVDVFQIEVDWPGTLAGHFIDMKQYVSADDLKDHIPTLVENNTVGRKARRGSLVRRCRTALLPQRPSRKISQGRPEDVVGAR